MNSRQGLSGMMTIARFNWPFYVAAMIVLAASVGSLIFVSILPIKLICAVVAAGAAYFIFISLGVSHLIYDCSDLYRWQWLGRALSGANIHHAIFCHSGFDESSDELRMRLNKVEWLILDHFNETQMTERSIRRARKMFPPTPCTIPSAYHQWPVNAESADVILGLLAIHELRSHQERCAWFSEARRCLRSGGRVVLVEHLRNFANFLAFGPGFLHFHSRKSWQQAWESVAFRLADEFSITPWVRVFILVAP